MSAADEAVQAHEDGWVDAKSLEAAGFVVDKHGKKWAVPNDNVLDLDDLGADSGYHFPKADEGFTYILIRRNELPKYLRLGGRPIERSELEIPEEMQEQYGAPITAMHEMFDAILIKIPTITYQKLCTKKNRIAGARYNEVNEIDKTRQKIEEDPNFKVRVTHSRNAV